MNETTSTSRSYLSARLPQYVFKTIQDMKAEARANGEDIVDLGMGNPDLATPKPIVQKLIQAARNPRNHRYSASRGILKLREAMANRYARRWGVHLDPQSEVVVTIGAKEGLSHLILTVLGQGESALVPEPAYPIHLYAAIIAGGKLLRLPFATSDDLLQRLGATISSQRPKLLLLSFPNNPTGACVDMLFFKEVVSLAKRYDVLVIHDFAYADLVFDGYSAPSILQIEGAKEVAVEMFSLSKSYSMPGWRVGFCVGNPEMIAALARVKSYLDYGIFQPIQIASIIALNECEEFVIQIAEKYRKRRNVLIESLSRAGWEVQKPAATMFVWAKIPDAFRSLNSLEFCKLMLSEAKVALSPGIGFGEAGEGHVRFALVENEKRIRQAVRGIKSVLRSATRS
ncbi:MAG TPA: aminotransferase class I/II-fold pyridoxal phosphate-dependent enzyme [Acidobacteriota bacterium]|jgi:alanine-synthesizing transaminase|nr:aminotransferase class I/II-fold pyridoxal phosphate-dependent enzyme [Acidobacteriota bacterium]